MTKEKTNCRRMKISLNRTLLTLVTVSLLLLPAISAHADTATAMAIVQAAVSDVFSIEFYTDANVLYTTNIPFTLINPTKQLCYADGRAEGDGKADTGVVCRSNLNVTWYLKMSVTATSAPAMPLANFKFYMGQPWNRTLNTTADGQLTYTPAWTPVPTASTVIYRAGVNDKNNLPYGTLGTLSFSIYPQGLIAGTTYTMNITYTIATSP